MLTAKMQADIDQSMDKFRETLRLRDAKVRKETASTIIGGLEAVALDMYRDGENMVGDVMSNIAKGLREVYDV